MRREDLAKVVRNVGAAGWASLFDPFTDGSGEGAVVGKAALYARAVEEADLDGAGATCGRGSCAWRR